MLIRLLSGINLSKTLQNIWTALMEALEICNIYLMLRRPSNSEGNRDTREQSLRNLLSRKFEAAIKQSLLFTKLILVLGQGLSLVLAQGLSLVLAQGYRYGETRKDRTYY